MFIFKKLRIESFGIFGSSGKCLISVLLIIINQYLQTPNMIN